MTWDLQPLDSWDLLEHADLVLGSLKGLDPGHSSNSGSIAVVVAGQVRHGGACDNLLGKPG